MEVLRAARVHERAILQTVLLTLLLIGHRDVECFDSSLVLQLQTGFGGAVLDHAEHLDEEKGLVDGAAISADVLVVDFLFAHVALVLNLDEVDLADESAHFYDVPDDVVRGHRLKQLHPIVECEVVHFLRHLSDHLEVRTEQLKLHVDVQVVRDLAQAVPDQHHLVLEDV